MLTKNDLSQIKNVVQEIIRPQINGLDTEIKALGGEITTIKKTMATKEDLKGMATKEDLKGMATKVDLETGLKGLEKRLIERIDEAQMEIIATVDKHKADKSEVDNLEKRVERLEDNAGLPPYPNQ